MVFNFYSKFELNLCIFLLTFLLKVGEVLYVAGQIGLIPGTMKLIEGGTRMECKLALRHLNRIMKATELKVELRDVVQV